MYLFESLWCSTKEKNPKGTDTILLVISYHSYNPNRHPDRLNYLLLDFVEKLYWVNDSITVLIGGDFNEDITEDWFNGRGGVSSAR